MLRRTMTATPTLFTHLMEASKMKPFLTCFATALAAVLMLGASTAAHAALLVYEGFNGYTEASLNGQNPNGNTTGLDTGTAYTTSGTFTYDASANLDFGSLITSGGAARISVGEPTDTLQATMDITSATGTVWSSFLVNYDSRPAATSGGTNGSFGGPQMGVGINDDLQSAADGFIGGEGAAKNATVAYRGAEQNGNFSVSDGVTYLVISKFTGIGSNTGTRTANLWVLTSAQFETFAADGEVTETELTTGPVVGSASQSFTGGATVTFNDGESLKFKVGGNENGTLVATLDEVRWGSTLVDVTPIPEPASLALMGLGGLLMLGRGSFRGCREA